MKLHLLTLIISLLTTGCAHFASDASPPKELSGDVLYDTQVILGACAPGAESGLLAAGLASSLIKVGVNRIGEAIKSAAGTETVFADARTTLEVRSKIGPCITVSRGWFYRTDPRTSGSVFALDKSKGWPHDEGASKEYWSRGLFIASVPDFFFQGAIITSYDGTKLAIRSLQALLNEPIKTKALRGQERVVSVFFALGEQEADLRKSPGTSLKIGKLKPGEAAKFTPFKCTFWKDAKVTSEAASCPLEDKNDKDQLPPEFISYSRDVSQWFAIGGTPDKLKPMQLTALVTETIDESEFLKFVGEVYADATPAIVTAAQQEFIPPVGQAAETKELEEKKKFGNSFDEAYGIARKALTKCAQNPGDSDLNIAARKSLRDFVLAAQQLGRRSGLDLGAADTIPLQGDAGKACLDLSAKIAAIS